MIDSSISAHDLGTPAITNTLPMRNPGAPEIGFAIKEAPDGNSRHAKTCRCQFKACGGVVISQNFSRPADRQPIGTPKAFAMLSAVMSSCVGPMPPVVKR